MDKQDLSFMDRIDDVNDHFAIIGKLESEIFDDSQAKAKKKAANREYRLLRHNTKGQALPLKLREKLITRAKGKCKLCGLSESMLGRDGKVRRLSTDHDHTTGKFRAVLCTRCNWLVGHFERHPEPDKGKLLLNFVAYLRDVCQLPLEL